MWIPSLNSRQNGGAGGNILLLIVALGLFAAYFFVYDPDAGEKLTGWRFMPKPQPIEIPVTPREVAFDLAAVAKTPDIWPKDLKLTKEHNFELIINGHKSGEIRVLPGSRVRLIKIEPDLLTVGYEAATARIPPADTDLISQLNESAHAWANREVSEPVPAPPAPEVDAGPGPEPIRSANDGSMPTVEAKIRSMEPFGSDIRYTGWTAPQVVEYQGKKHWEISVTAQVMLPNQASKGRVARGYRAYFRDRQLIAVETGKGRP